MDNRPYSPDKNTIQFYVKTISGTLMGRSKKPLPKGFDFYIEEYAKIAAFLNDTNAVINQLKKINALLVEKANKRGLITTEISDDGYLKHKKVLRDVLEEELAKFGFHPDFALAIDLLTPKVFCSTLAAGVILKDPGAGIDHGEFTHAIQWLVIGLQQQDTQFLNNSVIDLFKYIGQDKDEDGKEMSLAAVWDIIVDELVYKSNCTSPEYLHRLIRESNDVDLEMLKVLANERVKKREIESNKTTSLNNSGLFSNHEKSKYREKYPKKEYLEQKDGVRLPRSIHTKK